MKALTYHPDAPSGLHMAEVPAPVAAPSQALVAVHAVSMNFGEIAYLSRMRRPGEVPGWDAAGVIVAPAADGSGPPEGTRVSTFGWSAAWAELRAVETGELARIPDDVDLGVASAVPVAGVTALRALRRFGPLLGKRVLITGASGGVGRFAVQLARQAGAHAIALVSSEKRGDGLRALGAAEVLTDVDDLKEPVDGVVDNVGGALLGRAFARVARGGALVSVGMASREASVIDFEAERLRGGDRRIEVFTVGPSFGADLAFLLGLVAGGTLDPQVAWRGPWERAAEAAGALLGRQVNGKAVLDLRGGDR